MSLAKAARNAIALAKPKRTERLLVVTDLPSIEVGRALFDEATKVCKANMMVIQPTGQHGREPPKEVAKAMLNYDILFCPTTYSLTHTNAVRAARDRGARTATLPGITVPVFVRGMKADYKRILVFGEKLRKKYERAKWAHVTAKKTDFWVPLAGRRILNDKARLWRKGALSNLPAGEVGLSPTERKTYGWFTAYDSEAVKRGTTFVVGRGRVVACSDLKFKRFLWQKPSRRNVAEFSIGTNPTTRLSGNILEDEKVLGTCHVAVGDSKSLYGKVDSDVHQDFIIRKPTIHFDNTLIMKEGVFA
jgi:leucyl aminopeptidase (aminopeptidase T)